MLRDEKLTHLASTLNTFLQQCKEWKVRKGELFKRTKELGYKKHYAKQLLKYWGEWWRNDSEEDEEEDEEEEEEVEEEMEEEIEKMGLPISTTSAGKESSSKPEERPSPSDAVQRPSSTTDAVEGSAPSDAVQRPSSTTDAVEGSAPTGAVQRPSSTDAVEGSAPTDAVKELSLQEDGKMMENDTDTVDMNLDDNMLVEDSSLTAQPAFTSSSAASSAEALTSSSASNSNSFTSAEYDQIEQISDKLFSSYPRENDFSVIVLCLYVQALRTHFMTHKFFQSRSIYRRLHNVTTYKDHKNVLCKFSEGNTTLEDVRKDFLKVTGIETISNALQSMFMGRAFTILPNMQLPTKPPQKELMLTLNAINKTFTKFLEDILMSPGSISSLDLSVLFVEFSECDKAAGSVPIIDFPNRIAVSLAEHVYAYQTVGALYKKVSQTGVFYATRIVSRERLGGEYKLHQCFFSSEGVVVVPETLKASYLDQPDFDWNHPANVTGCFAEKKPVSFFPATITKSEPRTRTKSDKSKYYIAGVVLSLNEGQSLGLNRSANILPQVQNSLSEIEPVIQSGEHIIRIREMKMFEREDLWLSDEIMDRAYKKFLEVGKTKGLFSLDDPQQPKVVVISAHSIEHAVLRFLVKDAEGSEGSRKKIKLCKMIEEPTAKIDGSSLQEGYEHSKSLWDYKNIFSFPDAWFLSIINYPTATHWMLIGIHARSKTFFIYDPQGEVGQKESIRNAIRVYIDKEAASSGLVDSSLGSAKEWTYVECIAQEQLDTYNCGTLVLIAFFRIVSLISRNTPLLAITNRWYCSISKPAYIAYRKEIFHLLTDVFEVDVVMSQREARAAAKVPAARSGRQFAGFYYFHDVLIPKLQTVNQTFY